MGYSASELKKARDRYEPTGIHPINSPLCSGHHTEVPFSDDDKMLGDVLGWYMGGLFIDVEDDPQFMDKRMTSQDTWTRVARALRIHGLRLVDDPTVPVRDNPDYDDLA